MPSLRASTARPVTWSWCSWVMRMALRDAGSSPAAFMRLRSSRQERPASTRMVVLGEAMTVELPLEPEARTVIRIEREYALRLWDSRQYYTIRAAEPELAPGNADTLFLEDVDAIAGGNFGA